MRNLELDNGKKEDCNIETKYRELAESIGDVFFAMDKDLRYTYWNKKSEEISGFTAEYAIGRTFYDLYPELKGSDVCNFYINTIRDKVRGRFLNEFIYQGKKGVFEINAYPSREGVSVIAKDISEKVNLQESLKRSETKLRNIFDMGLDVKLIIEPLSGEILMASHSIEAILGYSVEYIRGKNFSLLYKKEFNEENPLDLDKVTNAGRVLEMVNIISKRDKEIPMDISAILIPWDNTNVAAITMRDVSERKLYEQEREKLIEDLKNKNGEMERFIYTVSHDLKSPLITINGFLSLIEKDYSQQDYENFKRHIDKVYSAANKMQSLFDGLLELSRVGKGIYPFEKINMAEIIKEVIELNEVAISNKRVDISCAKDMPEVVGDRLRLLEVWQNLINNAVKFTNPQETPIIEIGYIKKKGTIVFFIKDNGIGIDPKYNGKIFEIFDKLDPKSEGSGVGLAIVKRIIELHGGKIWAESEGARTGTVFYFTLPQQSL